MTFRTAAIALSAAAALAGCSKSGEIVIDQGVGITALRSVCPAVGIPDYTGDITTFSPAGARTSDALDIAATMTNVRTQCNDTGVMVQANATFDVLATRSNTSGARSVQLPFFVTVLRGGNSVVAKRVGTVTLNFADGQARAQVQGTAGTLIDRAEATLPDDIRRRITERRRAGQDEAAVDPLTEPDVRAALARANFEMLVGFQLSEEQLAYNATR